MDDDDDDGKREIEVLEEKFKSCYGQGKGFIYPFFECVVSPLVELNLRLHLTNSPDFCCSERCLQYLLLRELCVGGDMVILPWNEQKMSVSPPIHNPRP